VTPLGANPCSTPTELKQKEVQLQLQPNETDGPTKTTVHIIIYMAHIHTLPNGPHIKFEQPMNRIHEIGGSSKAHKHFYCSQAFIMYARYTDFKPYMLYIISIKH